MSFVLALLSTLVMEFTSSLVLGIYNQLSIDVLNIEVLFGPMLMKENYMLLLRPIFVVPITLLVVALTRVMAIVVRRIRTRQSVAKMKKNKNRF